MEIIAATEGKRLTTAILADLRADLDEVELEAESGGFVVKIDAVDVCPVHVEDHGGRSKDRQGASHYHWDRRTPAGSRGGPARQYPSAMEHGRRRVGRRI
jgi:hypothetical protein